MVIKNLTKNKISINTIGFTILAGESKEIDEKTFRNNFKIFKRYETKGVIQVEGLKVSKEKSTEPTMNENKEQFEEETVTETNTPEVKSVEEIKQEIQNSNLEDKSMPELRSMASTIGAESARNKMTLIEKIKAKMSEEE